MSAGLAALAGALGSFGGSGGDKLLGAIREYDRRKYLAGLGKVLMDGEATELTASTAPAPGVDQLVGFPQGSPEPQARAPLPQGPAFKAPGQDLLRQQYTPQQPTPAAQGALDQLAGLVPDSVQAQPGERGGFSVLGSMRTSGNVVAPPGRRFNDFMGLESDTGAAESDVSKARKAYDYIMANPAASDEDRQRATERLKAAAATAQRVSEKAVTLRKDQATLEEKAAANRAQQQATYARLELQQYDNEKKRELAGNLGRMRDATDRFKALTKAATDREKNAIADRGIDVQAGRLQLANAALSAGQMTKVANISQKIIDGEDLSDGDLTSMKSLGLTKTVKDKNWRGQEEIIEVPDLQKMESLAIEVNRKLEEAEATMKVIVKNRVKSDQPNQPDKPPPPPGKSNFSIREK